MASATRPSGDWRPGLSFTPHGFARIVDGLRAVGYSRIMQLIVREGRSKPYYGDHPSEISGAWIFRASHGAKDLCRRSNGKTGFRRGRIHARRASGNLLRISFARKTIICGGNWTRGSYFVECNETLNLASDQIALIEPEDRLLRAGGWHVPLFVRGHVDPVELLLTVGVSAIAREGECADRPRAAVPHR